MSDEIKKTESEWKKKLNPQQYDVCRLKGTEAPFTGEYWNTKTPGTYKCVACGQDLFNSDVKFDSGTGWPSFYDVVKKGNVTLKEDHSHGMSRTEVLCSRCGSHLGHLFNDGPEPTGLRYCINSASLKLFPR